MLVDINKSIEEYADQFTPEQVDDIRYTFQQSVTAINSWKSHQLRSLQQDKARTDILNSLEPNEVLITNDWAMKFLPQKYRETQADWFGKRGISWHISVAVHKCRNGNLLQQIYVHIIDKCRSQDTTAVIAIMEHTLRSIKEENCEIDMAYFRQDNAGCYHSAEILVASHFMKQATGIEVIIPNSMLFVKKLINNITSVKI